MPETKPPEKVPTDLDPDRVGFMTFTAANPYTIAMRLHAAGVAEIPGPRVNPLIAAMNHGAGAGNNEDAPWCASFVHFCHWILGYQCPPGPAGARAWLNAGDQVTLLKARRGDVVIFWRDSPDGWKGHVGFLHKWSSTGDPIIIGGNQDDKVSLLTMPRSRVLGVRRPKPHLTLVAAIDTLPEPTSGGSEV